MDQRKTNPMRSATDPGKCGQHGTEPAEEGMQPAPERFSKNDLEIQSINATIAIIQKPGSTKHRGRHPGPFGTSPDREGNLGETARPIKLTVEETDPNGIE